MDAVNLPADERFVFERTLGRGGMGEVFAARDRATGEWVAVKRIHRPLLSPAMTARLLREAEAAARVESAFVPRLFGVHEVGDDVLLVMELLPGETLARRFRRGGVAGYLGSSRTSAPANLAPLTWEEIRSWAHDLLRGLVDAHTAGVVHRDLKPANVMLVPGAGPFPRAMILDFGVCKVEGGADEERLTRGGDTLGTIAYMAPEQIRGARDVDERADLYALGTILFEAVAGELPFDGDGGDLALVARKLELPPRAIGPLARIAVPIGFDGFLLRALARRPEDRFASAQEMLRALRALGPATVPAGDGPLSLRGGDEGTTVPDRPLVPAAAPRAPAPPWPLVAIGIAGVLGIGIIYMLRSPRRETPVEPAPTAVIATPPRPSVAPTPASAPPTEASVASAPPPLASASAPAPSGRPVAGHRGTFTTRPRY